MGFAEAVGMKRPERFGRSPHADAGTRHLPAIAARTTSPGYRSPLSYRESIPCAIPRRQASCVCDTRRFRRHSCSRSGPSPWTTRGTKYAEAI